MVLESPFALSIYYSCFLYSLETHKNFWGHISTAKMVLLKLLLKSRFASWSPVWGSDSAYSWAPRKTRNTSPVFCIPAPEDQLNLQPTVHWLHGVTSQIIGNLFRMFNINVQCHLMPPNPNAYALNKTHVAFP